MIRLTRTIFFRQTKTKNTFSFIRKNSSESTAAITESEVNKFEAQEVTKKADPLLKEKLLNLNEKLKSNFNQKKNKSKILFQKENIFAALKPFKNASRLYAEEAEQITEMLTPFQAVEAMKILANSKKRPPFLLKALSSKIKLGIKDFQFKTYADIMYCAAVLSLKDNNFLNDLAGFILHSDKNNMSEQLATSILLSCGKLKYRNCELIDHLLSFLISQQCSNKALLTGLVTLAITNYTSPYGSIVFNELLKIPIAEFSITAEFVDFVWSSILISQFPVNHISKILSKNYIDNMKDLYGPINLATTNIKLQNINAAATYLIPSYDGPKLNKEIFANCNVSNSHSKFFLSVIDVIGHIFPNPNYLKTNVNTGAGFLLDVECYIDDQNKPLPLNKNNKGTKIGIMLLLFNDVCVGNSKMISGIANFQEKILKAQGYKVIQIFWDEYVNVCDKVEFFQKKLKACISC